MEKEDLKALKLPDSPGVYFFMGAEKQILYIGKATSLRNRVRSYFSADIHEKRSELIARMVKETKTVEVTETDSVLEALILETNLIRSHKPKYNTRSKDDKSYNHLIITNEEWPRVLVVRGKDITETFLSSEIKYQFGPFPSAGQLREILKIVRKLFKYYDTRAPIAEVEKTKLGKGKIDFNRQIGLYPSKENKEEYLRTIKHIRLLFEGKKRRIISDLRKEMMRAAKEQAFEEAQRYKNRIFALEHIQDVALFKRSFYRLPSSVEFRIEAYDIAHLFGDSMVGVMTVIENEVPKKSDYRKFKISVTEKSNDTAALKEVLRRRFAHKEWQRPDLIVVDGAVAQKNAALTVLEEYELSIPIIAVVKDDKHKPKRLLGNNILIEQHKNAILLANAEAHRFAITYHRQKQRSAVKKKTR